LTGYYVGTCKNATTRVGGNLVLLLHGTTEPAIFGELGLYGELTGGGPFYGTVTGKSVVFSTCVPAALTFVNWQAQYADQQLTGSFTTGCDHPNGWVSQDGVWVCSHVRELVSTPPSHSNLISLYNDGHAEGPFTMDNFARLVGSGCWPLNAVVALEDLTLWCSLRELLDFIKSKRRQQPGVCPSSAQETQTDKAQPGVYPSPVHDHREPDAYKVQAVYQQQPSFAYEVARETGKKLLSSVVVSLLLSAFGLSRD
jgi:hypothetical protein